MSREGLGAIGTTTMQITPTDIPGGIPPLPTEPTFAVATFYMPLLLLIAVSVYIIYKFYNNKRDRVASIWDRGIENFTRAVDRVPDYLSNLKDWLEENMS